MTINTPDVQKETTEDQMTKPCPFCNGMEDKATMKVIEIVNEQAKDDGLWFQAETASESYLQTELRRLHSAIEKEGGGE